MTQQRNSLNHDDIKAFYDEVYYSNVHAPMKAAKYLERLAAQLVPVAGERVLDVGCGAGVWLNALRSRGAKVAGVDISERAIEACKTHIPEGEFFCGPAEKLPFNDGTFDLITCLGSLEHFLDPESALREMSRVASVDARILILVPNAGFLTRRLGLFEGTKQADIKEQVLPLEEWERMFQTAGLTIKQRRRDLHVLSMHWIKGRGTIHIPLRMLQALLLTTWPISWQYQVYYMCAKT